ncbi:MAG: HTTM domain-containing protein [Chitinophagales bacterium]
MINSINKKQSLYQYFVRNKVHIAPLISFRIFFGLMLFGSTLRFILNGWIEQLYITPTYFFSYYGFEWIKPLSPNLLYVFFGVMLLAALAVMLGFLYRLSALLLFITFSYIELIDRTNYLNHYYFVSLVCFIIIFLPLAKSFSLDNVLFKRENYTQVPAISVNIIKVMLGVVYFYAGFAKVNHAWLIDAQPLKIWLSSKQHFPIVGNLLTKTFTAYLFSWFGCIFDLTIFFFLSWKKSRPIAYCFVIVFHVATRLLFPIGMFPFIMIVSTTIFFSTTTHIKLQEKLFRFNWNKVKTKIYDFAFPKLVEIAFILFISFQIVFPLRYLLYKGNIFWTEEGYRFSWRVMLMEKAGMATFFVTNQDGSQKVIVQNDKYLTPYQIKMMSTQPDMIVAYAHFIGDTYTKMGYENPKVFVDAFVSLNGSKSKRFIDNTVDLMKEKDSFKHKTWILDEN